MRDPLGDERSPAAVFDFLRAIRTISPASLTSDFKGAKVGGVVIAVQGDGYAFRLRLVEEGKRIGGGVPRLAFMVDPANLRLEGIRTMAEPLYFT